MKTYQGSRDEDGTTHVTVDGRGLNARLDLRNHSPTGLEWGYGGSGPAQLALAILADHFTGMDGQPPHVTDECAVQVYQEFKFRIVAALPHDRWMLTSEQIDNALKAIAEAKETK